MTQVGNIFHVEVSHKVTHKDQYKVVVLFKKVKRTKVIDFQDHKCGELKHQKLKRKFDTKKYQHILAY